MLNFVKIRPVGAELLHADGQTDMTQLTVAFRDLKKATTIERHRILVGFDGILLKMLPERGSPPARQ